MSDRAIPHEIEGWWRITETSTWPDDELDIIGPALIPDPPSYRDKWTGWRPY